MVGDLELRFKFLNLEILEYRNIEFYRYSTRVTNFPDPPIHISIS